MINFTKDNLIAVPKEEVQAGTPAIMVNDMALLLPGGTSVAEYDLNDDLDTLNDNLTLLAGIDITIEETAEIEDINNEIDILNEKLINIKG